MTYFYDLLINCVLSTITYVYESKIMSTFPILANMEGSVTLCNMDRPCVPITYGVLDAIEIQYMDNTSRQHFTPQKPLLSLEHMNNLKHSYRPRH